MDERLYQIVETNFRLQSMARRELAGTLRAHMVRTEDFMLAASEQMQRTTETLRHTREAVAEARQDLTAKLEAEADRLDEAVEALRIMASSHARPTPSW